MSAPGRQLWLLAGGNGAGKSTFYEHYLKALGLPFINADIIAREMFPDAPEEQSYTAAKIAESMRNRLLAQGDSFCFETVFSHESKIDFVAKAKGQGYQIILVFIHLGDEGLNRARISQRVTAGGHHVPDQKVEDRIKRLLPNIKIAIPLCDQVHVYDNSSTDNPFVPVASITAEGIEAKVEPFPAWLKLII